MQIKITNVSRYAALSCPHLNFTLLPPLEYTLRPYEAIVIVRVLSWSSRHIDSLTVNQSI